jgi:hypothetical protein
MTGSLPPIILKNQLSMHFLFFILFYFLSKEGHTLLSIFYHVDPGPRMSDIRLELLWKPLLGMKSGIRPIWKGCEGGEQHLLKLQVVPVGILITLQMGIMLCTLVLCHAFLSFFFSFTF